MTTKQTHREIWINCRAFRCEKIKSNLVRVYSDGAVWVWDNAAGHFTSCHILGRAARQRAKQLAAA
jgi:hypothetical protein